MKTPSCKTCGKDGHYKTFCSLNRKPIKTNSKPLQRTPLPRVTKPIAKRGKHADKWLKTRQTWMKQNPAQVFTCYICFQQVPRSQVTLDHVISRSARPDLRYNLDNLMPCCLTCNLLKGSKKLETLLKEMKHG